MYHEWNIVWQYMYWYSTIVSLMMIPIIQCTQVYCTCTFNILICTYHKTCWKLEHKSTCFVMCYIFYKDYFCQKKLTAENIFLDQFPIVHSRNINYHFFLKLVTMPNMYRDFLNVGFAQKENVWYYMYFWMENVN